MLPRGFYWVKLTPDQAEGFEDTPPSGWTVAWRSSPYWFTVVGHMEPIRDTDLIIGPKFGPPQECR